MADVFDALVSKRSYKEGFPLSRAFSIIEEGAGTHFDPHIAHAFLDARDDAAAIATEYGDSRTDKIPWVPTGTAAPPPQTTAS